MNDGVGFEMSGASALLAWWRDAGVDVAVRENAPSWRSLQPAAPVQRASAKADLPQVAAKNAPQAPTPTPAPPPAPAPAPLPGTLGEIEQWLAERSKELDARHLSANITEGAPLLVVGARGDGEDGLLPPAQALFDRMMAAIGIEAPPLAMIDPAFRPGQPARAPFDPMLLEAMRKRIALARPERLLILGDQAVRALLDAPLLKARGKAQMVEGVRSVATFHPRWLLDRPGDKRMAWQDLQILTGDE